MKRSSLLAGAGILTAALVSTPLATAGAAPMPEEGFDGARGFDIGASGKTVLADTSGAIYQVKRHLDDANPRKVKKIGQVSPDFLSASVAVAKDDSVWVLTAGAETPTAGKVFHINKHGKRRTVADINRYVAKHPDPFDLEDFPGDTNPYGIAAGRNGVAYVADAAANAVFKVWKSGKVRIVARVKPRMVPAPGAPAGTTVPSEAVTTSVTMGRDGAIYIGELRGGPETPGLAQVWRVKPGAMGVVCDPAKPHKGACTRYADGFTAIQDLDTGKHGSLYVAELSKMGWIALETSTDPAAAIGSIWKLGRNTDVRRELDMNPGPVILPGSVAVTPGGSAFASGPIFGPGGFFPVS